MDTQRRGRLCRGLAYSRAAQIRESAPKVQWKGCLQASQAWPVESRSRVQQRPVGSRIPAVELTLQTLEEAFRDSYRHISSTRRGCNRGRFHTWHECFG